MSIRIKVLIPVVLLMTVLSIVLGFTSYEQMKEEMVSMGVEQADMASNVAVKVVDGELLKKLTVGCEDSAEYNTILEAMSNIRETCGIKFLYTLYTDKTNVYYGVDTDTSESKCAYGDEFEFSYDELKDVFEGKDFVQDFIDYTEYGPLISVYKPIYDKDNNIVGVVGCDYDAQNVS